MKRFDFKNFMLVLCTIAAGACELFAHYVFTGGALPLHVTAGGFILAANVFGLIGKSILNPAPITVAQLVHVVQDKPSPEELGVRVAALAVLPSPPAPAPTLPDNTPPAPAAPVPPPLNVVVHS
jgi:hypothetical protein